MSPRASGGRHLDPVDISDCQEVVIVPTPQTVSILRSGPPLHVTCSIVADECTDSEESAVITRLSKAYTLTRGNRSATPPTYNAEADRERVGTAAEILQAALRHPPDHGEG